MIDVVLAEGRDRSVRRRHPWLWSGSVARVDGPAEAGAWVRVLSAEGETLGFGHLSSHSKLRVRMLSFGKDAPDDDWLAARVARAIELRASDPRLSETNAVRLVNAEGDGLPGLVADRYDDVVVVRCTSVGMVRCRDAIVSALRESSGAARGYERADAAAARREGYAPTQGVLWGGEPPPAVPFGEGPLRFEADVKSGQKTGFYLDQRDARVRVAALAAGRRVLDLFSYTGAFSVAAAVGGASSVTLVDSSSVALERARGHLESNAAGCPAEVTKADAFRWVRAAGEMFDLLVIDPPPLARAKRDVNRAGRAYKDLLLSALRRAAPGAWILAFACSHHVGPDLFRKIVFGASVDAGRPLQVLETLGASSDHPVSLDHPEGAYLTGLLLRA